MRIALCTLDGVTYEAADFRQEDGFDNKRRYLVCTECGMRAFYRSFAGNAREAHFGARPHAEGCTLAALEPDGTATGEGAEEDDILTTGQRILLDLNYGTPDPTRGGQPVGVTVRPGNGGARGVYGPAARDTMTRRLRPILRFLMESEDFRRSTQTIQIPEVGEFTIADFFVPFTGVTNDHVGSYRGFWGLVPTPNIDGKGTLWLNSGGHEDMSVLLDQGFIEEIRLRFHFEEVEDLAGSYVLALGELRKGPSGKRYVPISDPSRFALRLVR